MKKITHQDFSALVVMKLVGVKQIPGKKPKWRIRKNLRMEKDKEMLN